MIEKIIHAISKLLTDTERLKIIAYSGSIIFTLIRTVLAVRPRFQQWYAHRSLKKHLGAEVYNLAEFKDAIKNYVNPSCQLVDPANRDELGQDYAKRFDLFKVVDYLLEHPSEFKYIAILGDTGMGKTSFLLNYYARYLTKWKKYKMIVLPLAYKSLDDTIQNVDNKSETVLLLDALDEDTLAIIDSRQRILELCEKVSEFRTVVITSRTHFFSRMQEEPEYTGVIKYGVLPAGKKGRYIFKRLYLSPFDEKQVKKYLRHKFPLSQYSKRKRAQDLITQMPTLFARPMLLAYIDYLIDRNIDTKHSFILYEEILNVWLEREDKLGNTSKSQILEFCELLAFELYSKSEKSLPYDNISYLTKKFNLKIDDWQLSGRSLLNRDSAGNFKFAHRSFMEYLYVKHIVSLPFNQRPQVSNVWTEQMVKFLEEMIFYDIEQHGEVAFFLDNVDIIRFAHLEHGVKYFQFRSNPETLLKSQVIDVIKRNNFYDVNYNKAGKGISHFFIFYKPEKERFVLSLSTHLVWKPIEENMTYNETKNFVKSTNTSNFGGYNDWRLPTLEEAMSLLVSESEKIDADILQKVFDEVGSSWTIDTCDSLHAWIVNLKDKKCSIKSFSQKNNFLLVRSLKTADKKTLQSLSSFVKIALKGRDGEIETVWAEPLGNNLYKVDNVPFFCYGISLHDIVEAKKSANSDLSEYLNTNKKSGNRTIRIIFDFSCGETDVSKEVVKTLKEMGCNLEWFSQSFAAINIPPHVELDKVCNYLNSTNCRWENADPRFDELHPR